MKVSVIIPCYNAEKYLAEAVRSCLTQTVLPYEVIVINDDSTDSTLDVLKEFDSLIDIVSLNERGGESRARNIGMDMATGDYVAFLDADDIWVEDKLERQVHAFALFKDAVCCHGKPSFAWPVKPQGAGNITLRSQFPQRYNICIAYPSSAMVPRKSKVRFNEKYQHGEDTIYFAELSESGPFIEMDSVLFYYRQHKDQQSSDRVMHCHKRHMAIRDYLERKEAK